VVRWRRTISRSRRRSLTTRPMSMVVSAISEPRWPSAARAGNHIVSGSVARSITVARMFVRCGAVIVKVAPSASQAANTSCW
jgi:hypothetical protein